MRCWVLPAKSVERRLPCSDCLGSSVCRSLSSLACPGSEAATAGSLIGQKVVLNEFLAYLDLVRTPEAELSARSRLLLTYALCGFANLGSLGILIGGLSAMVPDRRAEIVGLAPRAMLVGFLTTLLSASVVGVTVSFSESVI